MKALPGSMKSTVPNALVVGDVDPEHPMIVTVVLRPRKEFNPSAQVPGGGMSREEFAAAYGATPEDVAKVEEYAASHHLSVAEINLGARTVVLRGRTRDMQKAFGVDFKMYVTEDDKRFRGREGQVFIPDELEGIVTAVFGLDDRPAAEPNLRKLTPPVVSEAQTTASTFNAPAVGKLYKFPPNLDGNGQCIAIIEFGGGYRMSDLDAYFHGLGMATPSIVSIGVNGASNNPGGNMFADGEVALDIEVAGSIAPKARLAVYFAPNTAAGFFNGINAAVHDSLRNPSVISISWGDPERNWTTAAMLFIEAAIRDAAILGVTVLTTSGDKGSSDGVNDGKPHVDFPGSAPSAVCCGGTRLVASSPTTIASETVWNDGPTGPGAAGGGVSNIFPKPAYQASIPVPKSPTGFAGRGVPDVSGNGDPVTGYNIIVGGHKVVIAGTSAVAPLYAGLVALLNQHAAPRTVGFIQPKLYGAHAICRDVTTTNNDYSGTLGVYKAGVGWDAASGLGSAIGSSWLAAL